MLSENINIPIMLAKITLKKSNGITTVDLAAFKPLMVKNCAKKPNIVAKNIINSDFGEGNKANWKYGKTNIIQLNKVNQNWMFNVSSYNEIFFINIFTKEIKNAPNKA